MRAEKQLLLDEIKELMEGASSIVFTKHDKMGVNTTFNFRKALHEKKGGFEVVRKRILKKAAEKSSVDIDALPFDGSIAFAYSTEDPVDLVKEVFAFSKENAQSLEVIGGRFEGKYCSAEEMKIISDLPSRDQMRAQLLSLFEAPAVETVSVMDALLLSVIHCLENKASEAGES